MNAAARAFTRNVVAYNDAVDSGNPMHDDAVAQALNFKGALVPGVSVFGYMTHACLSQFGDAWLTEGRMQVKFVRPVYAEETVSVEALSDATGGVLEISVLGPGGETCAVGSAAMAARSEIAKRVVSADIAPEKALPETPWPPLRDYFEREPVLGSIEARMVPEDAAEFLHNQRDDHPVYSDGAAHPAWLLRQANIIVDQNYDLGPWIHVASELHNLGQARTGDKVQIRAQVVDLFEKKGRDYVDLDVLMLVDGDPSRPVMRVLHSCIYNMHADV